MGGIWERLVRSIKRILQALLPAQTITDEVFTMLLAEVEGIINSRPLTPVTIDPQSEEPLTPNHFILLRGNVNLPPGLFEKGDCYTKKCWAQCQYMANQFWRSWLNEFVSNLSVRQKWFKGKPNIKKNDLVLLVDNLQQRSEWLLGRVVDVFPDRKGRVRVVTVKTKHGYFKRTISKLCIISDQKESNSQPCGQNFAC